MSDERAGLVLNMLRAIRGDLGEGRTDLAEVKDRLGIVESQSASLSRRADRQGGDVEQARWRRSLIEA